MENIVLTEKLLKEYGFWKEVDTSYRKTYICDKNVCIEFLCSYKTINIILLKPRNNPEDLSKVLKKICLYGESLLLSDLQKALDFFELELEKIPLTFWIARNTDGLLYLYNKKPVKSSYGYHTGNTNDAFCIDDTLFPNITYEGGPRRIILKWR